MALPPIDPRGIWRAARTLMAEHGEGAPTYAARRVLELRIQRNIAEAERWTDIMAAIDALQELDKPPKNDLY